MLRLQDLTKILPKLSFDSVKGNNGLVGVIGGSFQYTGAPFYTAMGALKMGADLAHVFCSKQAAGPIKTYSPQLIVHPIFTDEQQGKSKLSQTEMQKVTDKWVDYFRGKINKITSWVIGPGLGRGKSQSCFFPKFIKMLPKKSNLTIDADGLFFLCQYPQLIENLSKLNCYLTPNHRQFAHLNKFFKIEQQIINKFFAEYQAKNINKKQIIGFQIEQKEQFPLTIVIKGEKDLIIHRDKRATIVETIGGLKRCGGIGDILAGCIACCTLWDPQNGAVLACHITKQAARKAFQKHGRSLTAVGVLDKLEEVVKQIQ